MSWHSSFKGRARGMFSKIGPCNRSRGPWSRNFLIQYISHIQKRHEDKIVSVTLPRGLLQGIIRMMKLTTHGLFLTCKKNSVFIFSQHIVNYLGITPYNTGKKKTPITWKANVLLMVANPHPLWSLAWYQLPSPYFPIPLHLFRPFSPYYVTMTTSTTSVFLSGIVST